MIKKILCLLILTFTVLIFTSYVSKVVVKAENVSLTSIELGDFYTFSQTTPDIDNFNKESFNNSGNMEKSLSSNTIIIEENDKTKLYTVALLKFKVKVSVPQNTKAEFDIKLDGSFCKNATGGTAKCGVELFNTDDLSNFTTFTTFTSSTSYPDYSIYKQTEQGANKFEYSKALKIVADNYDNFEGDVFEYGFCLFVFNRSASSYDHKFRSELTISLGNIEENKIKPTLTTAEHLSDSSDDASDGNHYFTFSRDGNQKDINNNNIGDLSELNPQQSDCPLYSGPANFNFRTENQEFIIEEKESNKYQEAIFIPLYLSFNVPAYTRYDLDFSFEIDLTKNGGNGTALCGVEIFNSRNLEEFESLKLNANSSDNSIYKCTTTESKKVTFNSSTINYVFNNVTENEEEFGCTYGIFAFCNYGSSWNHQFSATIRYKFESLSCQTKIFLGGPIGGLNKEINVTAGSSLSNLDLRDINDCSKYDFLGYYANSTYQVFDKDGIANANFKFNLIEPLYLEAKIENVNSIVNEVINNNTVSSLKFTYVENEGKYTFNNMCIRTGALGIDKDSIDSSGYAEYGVAICKGDKFNAANAEFYNCSNLGYEDSKCYYYLLISDIPSYRYNYTMCARAYVKLNDVYYYLNETVISVKSIAQKYLTLYNENPGEYFEVGWNIGAITALANE